ncbi:hypothetical protein [Neorhizobium sp. LjRoot104]|uniref:hypothetical protein n=1 Tax=Neorhizobium sp. LjRoot104 TaxID=3342254 RepID=UPI003ED05B3B
MRGTLDVVAYRSGDYTFVEFDKTETETLATIPFLVTLDGASSRFERSSSVKELCREAAAISDS